MSPPFPERLFKFGYEPQNKKVNTYFQLNYLDAITFALEDDHIDQLMDSQFGKLFQAGNKIASSVRFLHFLLSRQLVTNKKKEIWCIFSGQPIRFSMREFGIATGLDFSSLPSLSEGDEAEIKNYTKELFGSEKNATPLGIANTLLGRPYKDKDTRFRLALLLLVDGIVCPTSKNTKINGEHILMVRDVDDFLSYPWGRKSFDLTMESIKSRCSVLSNLCQSTCAFQGFLHGLQMVVLACVPSLMSKDVKGKKHSLVDDENDEDEAPILRPGAQKAIQIPMNHVRTIDKEGKVSVKHILEDEDNVFDEEEFCHPDEVEDSKVENLIGAIEQGTTFTHKSWVGGSKASEYNKITKPQSSTKQKSSSPGGDEHLEFAATAFFEKVVAANSKIMNALNSIQSDFRILRKDFDKAYSELFLLRSDISNLKADTFATKTKTVSSSSQDDEGGNEASDDGDNQGVIQAVNKTLPDADNVVDNQVDVQNEDITMDRVGVNKDGLVEDDHFVDDATRATNRIVDVLNDINSSNEVADGNTDTLPKPSENTTDLPIPDLENTKDHPRNDISDVPDTRTASANTNDTGNLPDPTNDLAAEQVDVNNIGSIPRTDLDKDEATLLPQVDDPPAFSLGLTQEEKAREKARQSEQADKDVMEPSKVPLPTRKSSRQRITSTKSDDFVYPQKRLKKTENSVDLSSFFPPPTAEQVSYMEVKLKETSRFPTWYDVNLTPNVFYQILSRTKPISILGMNAVFACLRDQLWVNRESHPTKYDFVEFGLINEIVKLHREFVSPNKWTKITLPAGAAAYVKNRQPWYTSIARIYCPFQIDSKHWVGLCIDLEAHDITIINCNPAFKEMKLKMACVPIAESLPHFIRKVAYNAEMKNDRLDPFNVTVAKPVFQSPTSGLSGVLTIMLIQLHAENLAIDTDIGDDTIRDAALTYAYDLLCKVDTPISEAPPIPSS
ncbi:uncharacterized protein LOC112088040 [Eutrema salsugineum]|uniref:uncharacterized protein LOC112088040 n=1 Tax=Eutrema salsugineum TaxID=72664 RepID=UPI000CED025E|nr:uncharacterized protein LOC112088040 [Eutrema salsugineum]